MPYDFIDGDSISRIGTVLASGVKLTCERSGLRVCHPFAAGMAGDWHDKTLDVSLRKDYIFPTSH
jgi:hypothetical protein